MCDVDGADVIRLVEQFCEEHGLVKTAAMLQTESGVGMASLDAAGAERLKGNVKAGKWDAVLTQTSALELNEEVLCALYEHIVLELVAIREREAARTVLQHCGALQRLQQTDSPRYKRLQRATASLSFDLDEHLAASAAAEGRPPITSERRRAQIASMLTENIDTARPARLLELLGKGLRYEAQQQKQPQEQEKPSTDSTVGSIDLLTGEPRSKRRRKDESSSVRDSGVSDDRLPSRLVKAIKVDADGHFECACFAPSDSHVAMGTIDGFAEVWDGTKGERDMGLTYQKNEEFIMHDTGILSLAFNETGDVLATGDASGNICLWSVSTGRRLCELKSVHSSGVTCLSFGTDSTQLVSGSFDNTAKTHGLRSRRTLLVFRGHESVVNSASLVRNGSWLVTASSDSTIRYWDAHTAQCLNVVRTETLAAGMAGLLSMSASTSEAAAVLSKIANSAAGTTPAAMWVKEMPDDHDTLFVGMRTSAACLVDLNSGKVIRAFAVPGSHAQSDQSKKKKVVADTGASQAAIVSAEGATRKKEFVSWSTSPSGKVIYCATEGGMLFSYNARTGTLEGSLQLVNPEKEGDCSLIGISTHPKSPSMVSWTDSGIIKFWLPPSSSH